MLLARTGGWRSFQEAATAVDVLQEGGEEEIAPPSMLPHMPERIRVGVPGFSTAEQERINLTSRILGYGPVVRYALRDCLVHGGGVEYQGGFRPKSNARRRDRIPLGPIEDVAAGSYCMNPISHKYFGHWLRDACTKALLARPGELIFLDERPDWPDVAPYAAAFQLPTRRAGAAFVSTLHVYSDPGLGPLKRQRYQTLRQRAHERLRPADGPRRPVYLRRGLSGSRRELLNEAELCSRLSAEGFEIVDLSFDFGERFGKLANAPIVVSIEGSHLNHAHFAMKAGSAVLALIPAARPSASHRVVSHCMGMRFGCVVFEGEGPASVVDPDEVMRTLDLLL